MKTNIENTQSLLHEFGLSAKKSLGQNFLISQNVVNQIINNSNITNEDIVIEIGPGIGALSEELCKKAKKVYLFEIDKTFEDVLKNRLNKYKNYELFIMDFLKLNLNNFIDEQNINQKIIVVSNLPYYITSKLLLSLFKNSKLIKNITVMMQKDVGIKFLYSNNNKEKNTLSLLINIYSNIKEICEVSYENFLPKPHVDSIVLRFDILENSRYKIINEDNIDKRLNALFIQRRKTISKNLNLIINSKEKIEELLKSCNINSLTRVEELETEKIIELCNKIEEL